METNDLGFVASLMFVLVPTVFLLVLYIPVSYTHLTLPTNREV